MKTPEVAQSPEAIPDELLDVLVDRAVRRIRPMLSDADVDDVRAVVRSACESDPVLLLLLRDNEN